MSLLRAHGIDALIDVEVAARPQYWPDWMSAQIREGGYVLVIGSPDYRAVAEDRLPENAKGSAGKPGAEGCLLL